MSSEVDIVGDIIGCRACKWFWDNLPYGPYPAYDFGDQFPTKIREEAGEQATLCCTSAGLQQVMPVPLSGCRKAPIMTIGINPNLTAFWPGVKSGSWCYPFLRDDAQYAYYYRHHRLCQESMPEDFIAQNVSDKGQVIAKDAGYIKRAQRPLTGRRMTLTIQYEELGETEETFEWGPDRHFVMLYDRQWKSGRQFEKGQAIAGLVDLPNAGEVEVSRNQVGYYLRFVPILENFASFLRSQGIAPSLEIGEDVSQLDMVACASPGWSDKYEIDKNEVVSNCVQNKGWVTKQLAHARPQLIVFSGRSAFEMFASLYGEHVTPALDTDGDVYGLLSKTVRIPHYLDIQGEVNGLPVSVCARIVISPHFSYDDNFVPHSRFSEERWEKFQAECPEAFQELTSKRKIGKKNRDGFTGVLASGLGDFQVRHREAMSCIMRHFYEPSSLIADVLKQEFVLGNLEAGNGSGKLARTEGTCRFCVNDKWKFPEGCPYR